jgi:hypothetical protein
MRDTPPSAGGVDDDGTPVVAKQRIHVGIVHAGRTLTVEAADTTWRIYDGAELLTEVGRTSTRPIARFKVASLNRRVGRPPDVAEPDSVLRSPPFSGPPERHWRFPKPVQLPGLWRESAM